MKENIVYKITNKVNEKYYYGSTDYEDIVSFRAFKKVWHGDTFSNIYPNVFTKENKDWHFAKGQSRPGEKNGKSKLTTKDVQEIRRRKQEGETPKLVYEDYKHKGILYSGFCSVWRERTWKNI